MNVTMTLDVAEVTGKLDRVRESLQAEALEAAAFAGGSVIAQEWQTLFRAAEDKAIPGLPPRSRTGAYRESIDVQPEERDVESASVVIGSLLGEPYPTFLEFGTSKMAAYPIARPAYETAKGPAIDAVQATLRAGVRS